MVSEAFQDRILNDLLPAFCDRPDRTWCRDGFQNNWANVSDCDATDFLRAMDAGLIKHLGRGLYRAPRSLASEAFFWEGHKNISPRRLTLWREPIITVAVLARLHFDLGWPANLIGTQSRNWEFDVTAYRSCDPQNEYVACEVKKTVAELEQMIELMHRFSSDDKPVSSSMNSKKINAYKKLAGLKLRRAALFWAVGPGNMNHIFQMEYGDEGSVAFKATDRSALMYPGG